MEGQNIKMEKVSKKIESIDYIYSGTLIIFFIITALVFSYFTSFILKNVNKIFLPIKNTNSHTLDKERYSLLEKKLGLPINSLSNANIPITTTQSLEMVPPIIKDQQEILKDSTSTIPEINPTKEINLRSLTVNIINSAKKAGVASKLAQKLEAAGFSLATTKDATKTQTGITILIKKSKTEYTTFVEEVVKTTYPKATTETNPESSKFDVVITIGK